MYPVRFERSKARRRWLFPVLMAMILLFTGGCNSTEISEEEKGITVSPLDGSNNIACGGLSVTQNDTIYYVGEGEQGGEAIYAMDLSGENIHTVYTPERYLNQLCNLNLYDNRLYFCETVINDDFGQDEMQINALDLSDFSVEKVYGSALMLSSIYFYKDRVYFGEWRLTTSEADFEADSLSNYQLKVMDADGENLKTLLNYYNVFLIYDDMFYYRTDKGLSRCNLEGKKKESLYRDDNGITGLQVVDGRLYFMEYRNERAPYFMSMELDGGNPQRVFKDEFPGGAYMANARDHQIFLGTEEYVSPWQSDTMLMTINLDGSGKGVVVSTEDDVAPGYVWSDWCISGDWLFYAESDGHNGRVLYKEPWPK